MENKVFNKKQRAIQTVMVVLGDLSPKIDKRNVIVMAIHGKHAMVKRPKCVPYVCKADCLEFID